MKPRLTLVLGALFLVCLAGLSITRAGFFSASITPAVVTQVVAQSAVSKAGGASQWPARYPGFGLGITAKVSGTPFDGTWKLHQEPSGSGPLYQIWRGIFQLPGVEGLFLVIVERGAEGEEIAPGVFGPYWYASVAGPLSTGTVVRLFGADYNVSGSNNGVSVSITP